MPSKGTHSLWPIRPLVLEYLCERKSSLFIYFHLFFMLKLDSPGTKHHELHKIKIKTRFFFIIFAVIIYWCKVKSVTS